MAVEWLWNGCGVTAKVPPRYPTLLSHWSFKFALLRSARFFCCSLKIPSLFYIFRDIINVKRAMLLLHHKPRSHGAQKEAQEAAPSPLSAAGVLGKGAWVLLDSSTSENVCAPGVEMIQKRFGKRASLSPKPPRKNGKRERRTSASTHEGSSCWRRFTR